MEKRKEALAETIEKAKTGNQMAFSFLLDSYWNELYGFLLIRTKNENDAEDIAIETFSRAFDKIKTYDSSYEFNTWLLTIAKNLHVDMIRKRKRSPYERGDTSKHEAMGRVLDDAPTAEDRLITEQNLNNLLLHIKKLKPHYQQVINLRYFHELTYAEIADELGEPINNIKVKLLRAKKLLAELIQGGRPA